jgi:hypothetical protein
MMFVLIAVIVATALATPTASAAIADDFPA